MPKDPKRAIRELEREGCVKKEGQGKGGHQKIYNPSKNATSVIPMHGEIDDALWKAIRRQLQLDD